MHQIEFSFEVLYTMIAGLLFSTCWDLLWWIKMNLVWRWQMQWLQEYYFLHVGKLCDASKQIFFWSIVCNDCKNTFVHILGPSLKNQNKFSFDVLRIICNGCKNVGKLCDASKKIFSSIVCCDCKSTIFLMLGYFVMNQNTFCFEVMYAVKLQDYCFLPDVV